MFNRFKSSTNGNIAIMFGLFLIPILVGAGIALDMMRASQFRTQMNEAADSGLLAAARSKILDKTLTDVQAQDIARRYFDANGVNSADIEIQTFEFIYDAVSDVYRLTVTGRIKTALMGIAGKDWVPINIISEASVAPPRALEVAMVLDNTGSMSGQKINDLRDAATLLIDTIMADTNNEVLVGLVPFSTHVNIGMSRALEPWLAIPADSSYMQSGCSVDATAATSAGCTEESATCYSDGFPYSCTTWQCPGGASAPQTCAPESQPTSWQGCVGSRVHPLNIQDADFTATPVPGVLNDIGSGGDCPGEIFPMTTDKADVLAEIAAMNASGNTYIPGGLTWGLRLISSASPFIEGDTYANIQSLSGVKAIVLMTDGANTKSPRSSDGAHYDNDVSLADQYTLEVCDEIKANNIILYTIAFDITDSGLLDMMSQCATNSDAFFNAEDAVDLSDAFGVIGNNLTELALTK